MTASLTANLAVLENRKPTIHRHSEKSAKYLAFTLALTYPMGVDTRTLLDDTYNHRQE